MKTSARTVSWTTLLFTLLIAVSGFAAIAYRNSTPPRKSNATTHKPDKIIPVAAQALNQPTTARVKSASDNLPLTFELNQGQTDAQVKFLSRGSGYNLFLTPTESILQLRSADFGMRKERIRSAQRAAQSALPNPHSAIVKMKLVNANPAAAITGLDELPGKSNYLLGNDPSQWRTNVPNYAKVKYTAVYPGIDLVYYGNQRQLEYDLIVAPHADPNVIQLRFDGARKIRLNPQGDLELFTSAGKVIHHKPNLYQSINYPAAS